MYLKKILRIKTALRESFNLKVPVLDEKFILKTDASNSGLCTVLLQENNHGNLVSIQYESKKFTQTDKKNRITENRPLRFY